MRLAPSAQRRPAAGLPVPRLSAPKGQPHPWPAARPVGAAPVGTIAHRSDAASYRGPPPGLFQEGSGEAAPTSAWSRRSAPASPGLPPYRGSCRRLAPRTSSERAWHRELQETTPGHQRRLRNPAATGFLKQPWVTVEARVRTQDRNRYPGRTAAALGPEELDVYRLATGYAAAQSQSRSNGLERVKR